MTAQTTWAILKDEAKSIDIFDFINFIEDNEPGITLAQFHQRLLDEIYEGVGEEYDLTYRVIVTRKNKANK